MAMNRQYFAKKYDTEIRAIASANEVDLSVGCDMFICNIKHAFNVCHTVNGELVLFEEYEGLTGNYNYRPAAIDYLQVI